MTPFEEWLEGYISELRETRRLRSKALAELCDIPDENAYFAKHVAWARASSRVSMAQEVLDKYRATQAK